MNLDYLFVYGTLQEAVDNDMSRFLSQNSQVIGKGYFNGELYSVSWFPGAVLNAQSLDKVYGTIFKLKDAEFVFKTLDAYEGYNTHSPKTSLFTRALVPAYLDNGTEINTWVYLFNQSVSNYKRIFSGDFLKDA